MGTLQVDLMGTRQVDMTGSATLPANLTGLRDGFEQLDGYNLTGTKMMGQLDGLSADLTGFLQK